MFSRLFSVWRHWLLLVCACVMMVGCHPVADINSPDVVDVNTVVDFTSTLKAEADGLVIVGYDWQFGDESVASGMNVSHTYTKPGVYRVSLIVKEAGYETDVSKLHETVKEIRVKLPDSATVVTDVPVVDAQEVNLQLVLPEDELSDSRYVALQEVFARQADGSLVLLEPQPVQTVGDVELRGDSRVYSVHLFAGGNAAGPYAWGRLSGQLVGRWRIDVTDPATGQVTTNYQDTSVSVLPQNYAGPTIIREQRGRVPVYTLWDEVGFSSDLNEAGFDVKFTYLDGAPGATTDWLPVRPAGDAYSGADHFDHGFLFRQNCSEDAIYGTRQVSMSVRATKMVDGNLVVLREYVSNTSMTVNFDDSIVCL